MRGVITGKDIIEHFPTIWRSFGARCALRCLTALLNGRPTTFLDIVFASKRARAR